MKDDGSIPLVSDGSIHHSDDADDDADSSGNADARGPAPADTVTTTACVCCRLRAATRYRTALEDLEVGMHRQLPR